MYQDGDVLIVRTKKAGLPWLPCLPARNTDETVQIQDGVLLSITGFKNLGINSSFYIAEVCTGTNAGDLIYVGTALSNCLEKIPSRRR